METLATELVRTLALQGTGWLLFSLALIGNIFLLKKVKDAYDTCREQSVKAEDLQSQLYEKRISEATKYLDLLHQGTLANQKLADSISTRTETLNAVIEVVKSVERDVSELAALIVANNNEWKLRVTSVETNVSDSLRIITEGQLRIPGLENSMKDIVGELRALQQQRIEDLRSKARA